MVLSMTGFASKTVVLTQNNGEKVTVSMSIKSLNSRYFEVNAKIPYPLSNLETDLTKIMQERLIRGKIYFTLSMSNPAAFKGSIEPSLSTIQEYLTALERIKTAYHIEGSITISDIMQLPNIFNIEERNIDEESQQKIFAAVNELIDGVLAMRTVEGKALEKDIIARLQDMDVDIAAVAVDAKRLMEEQKIKVQQALAELGGDEEAHAELQRRAVYTALDKMDINEEIVRFKTHLKSLRATLDTDASEKGKRIDFTLQELGREINTIAAKCSDASISSRAINIKVDLEKAREQAQNIV